MERKNAWKDYSEYELMRLEAFAREYCAFLDAGKTERECAAECEKLARAAGFQDLNELIAAGKEVKSGDKVYANWMGKSFVAFIIGEECMQKGMNILGAHIDSPRIDVKQNPMYEDGDFAYLDTHYYGGIKKYQWVALPLAIHGVIAKKDGSVVTISVGEKEDDPVFCISDLLPHLAQEQMKKDAPHVIEGEGLDLIIGGRPVADCDKEAVKTGVINILKGTYGIEEEDFLSAELEIVPAGKARDMGFDRSMIMAYGHDDRVCAYPSLRALTDFNGVPKRTLCCILVDKEEIGSVGATGMESRFFENICAELYALTGKYSELGLRRMLANSRMLSSDVSAGFDPLFASAFEKKNAAFLGRGICFNKYTGARGKSGSSDANAEFVAFVRKVMDDANVAFQTAELGRVDLGGGGTIAYICANYGMNVIDAGVAVLSMHAPFEVISKADLFETYKAYCAFLNA